MSSLALGLLGRDSRARPMAGLACYPFLACKSAFWGIREDAGFRTIPSQRTSDPVQIGRDVNTWQLLTPPHPALRFSGPLRPWEAGGQSSSAPGHLRCLPLWTPASGVEKA